MIFSVRCWLSDCRRYVLNIDEDESALSQWQHAAKLMLAAAEGGSLARVEVAADQPQHPTIRDPDHAVGDRNLDDGAGR